jgi:hypothetical protein
MVTKASLLDTYDLITDFLAGGIENSSTNLTSQNALLREIYERYIYFIGNYEAFTDYRRTNNIGEIKIKAGFDGTPQRLIYSQEINANPVKRRTKNAHKDTVTLVT